MKNLLKKKSTYIEQLIKLDCNIKEYITKIQDIEIQNKNKNIEIDLNNNNIKTIKNIIQNQQTN